MNIKYSNNIKWLAITLIVFAIISRLIPHEYNFAPFGAIALFASAYFAKKSTSILITVIAAWVSGVILNNFVYTGLYNEFVLIDENILWQSLSYITIIFVGKYLFRNEVKWYNVLGGALASSLLFFVITNFGFWISGLVHPRNFQGLISCFVDAVPFFRSTLLGDLFYSAALFGSYYYISNTITANKVKSVA